MKILTHLFYWFLDYEYISRHHFRSIIKQSPTPDYKQRRSSHTAQIVLIPGVYENWSFMQPLTDYLFNEGYSLHVIEQLAYNTISIEKASEIVDAYLMNNKIKECIIVAHSKGGLIGKNMMMSSLTHHHILGMVAINTPFAGSVYAYLLPAPSLRIFHPRSSIISKLTANIIINKRIVSIYSEFDPHIPSGSYLEGARNIQHHTFGHFRPINDPILHRSVLESIQKFEQLKK